jgi:uncharacterized protein (TIGR02996 family)
VVEDVEIARLYDEVYDHPADDQVRLVLADALITRGDPRGELIQLQLRPDRDPSRAMQLVQQHGMTWLGPLRDVVLPLAYERGFLARCQLVADPAPVAGRREWSTVHTIALPVKATPWRFSLHPIMRSLACLENATPRQLLAYVTESPAQLARTRVSVAYQAIDGSLVRDLLAKMPENALAALAVRYVPYYADDELRTLAAKRHPQMKLELDVEPPPEVDDPNFPGELGS